MVVIWSETEVAYGDKTIKVYSKLATDCQGDSNHNNLLISKFLLDVVIFVKDEYDPSKYSYHSESSVVDMPGIYNMDIQKVNDALKCLILHETSKFVSGKFRKYITTTKRQELIKILADEFFEDIYKKIYDNIVQSLTISYSNDH